MIEPIHAATLADIPAIARVHVQSWRETYAGLMPRPVLDGLSVELREAMWQRALTAATVGVFVAEADGTVVGFASVGPARDAGEDAELYALYLLRAHQGTGLGRALWSAALDFARDRGAATLMLWALETNPTRGFYERMGGVLAGRKVERVEGPSSPR